MFGESIYRDVVFVLTKYKCVYEDRIYSVRGDNIYSFCGEENNYEPFVVREYSAFMRQCIQHLWE